MSSLSKSPWIIHYDASSCNGCDIEVLACLTPVFDVERLGVVNTGNPKHADIFLVTGAVNEQSQSVIRNLYTLHLQNKTDRARVYKVAPAADALAGQAGVEYIIPQDRLELPALADRQVAAFVTMPMTSYREGAAFSFTVTDSISGVSQDIKVRFLGP